MRFAIVTIIGTFILFSTAIHAEGKEQLSSELQAKNELENLGRFEELHSIFGNYTTGELTPGIEDYKELEGKK